MYKKFFKRLMDIAFSLLALIALSPILLIVTILVKTKLGSPVLYTAPRPGKGGKIFNLHKFRTMTNERDEDGELLPDAQRLTRLGRILRKTSLDELPELWDILIGKMSLIGPRPLSTKYLPYYTEYENQRHNVRPGMTGLAQINGRSGLNWEERFRYDAEYVNNLTFLMDIKIFFATIYKVIKRADTLEREEISLLNFNDYRERQWENSKNLKEIGSDFWLADKEIGDGYLANKFAKAQFVFSGRTAIDYIVRDVINKGIEHIFLPSFLCQSVIDAVQQSQMNIIYYDVFVENQRFCADLPLVEVDNAAIMVCDYFFFDQEYYKKLLAYAKENNMVVIHDITHSLLSENLDITQSDYYFASLRKWLGVPDGAIVGKRGKKLQIKGVLYKEHTDIKMQAMKKKRHYMLNNIGDKSEFRALYHAAEELLEQSHGQKQISGEALEIIKSTNFDRIINDRKNNALVIAESIKEFEQVKAVYEKGACPLFVPILFDDKEQRDAFRNHMVENDIYLPIHWAIPNGITLGEKTQEVYDNILSIVVDQRYATSDMEKIICQAKRCWEKQD